MHKKINSMVMGLKTFLKKDFIKLISLLFIIGVSIIGGMAILAYILVNGLAEEGKQREKEIDRLYKEGVCNVHEPCYYP